MGQDYEGAQREQMRADLKQTITQLGIEYRLMTQFTSFVAVEEMIVTDGGQPRRIDVPVEVPAGVNQAMVDPASPVITQGFVGGLSRARGAGGGGRGFGIGAGVASGGLSNRVAPPPNQPATVSVTATVANSAPSATPKPVDARRELDASDAVAVKSVDELKVDQLRLKLHPEIFAVVTRLRNKQLTPRPDEVRFVRDDKAEVQIWLTEKSAEAFAKLKELGFEVVLDQKTSKLMIGRIAIDKLEALADLKFVRYVSPQMRN
jgi:hypothetical protein